MRTEDEIDLLDKWAEETMAYLRENGHTTDEDDHSLLFNQGAALLAKWQRQPREPAPSHASTLAGSGAVFCDPTTLSNSQLIDTVEACQDEYDKRAGLVRVPMEMVPVDEPAFPLCPEHAIRLPCPACATREDGK